MVGRYENYLHRMKEGLDVLAVLDYGNNSSAGAGDIM